jgi:hypothetical protein
VENFFYCGGAPQSSVVEKMPATLSSKKKNCGEMILWLWQDDFVAMASHACVLNQIAAEANVASLILGMASCARHQTSPKFFLYSNRPRLWSKEDSCGRLLIKTKPKIIVYT